MLLNSFISGSSNCSSFKEEVSTLALKYLLILDKDLIEPKQKML